MSDKRRPRLHRVQGNSDEGLFSEELSWFYGAMDSLCGNSSAMGSQVAVLMGVAGGNSGQESNMYTDSQVGFGSHEGHFTRGRRIWQQLQRIPYKHQRFLAWYYEPRSDLDNGEEEASESDIRTAHAAYYETGNEQT